jgi:alginate O-acetyltransferase complex protein AlgJ
MNKVVPQRLDLPPSRDDGKVVRGKDGWLFLDNDTNRVVAQHTGEVQLTPDQLDHWHRLLENRIAWLERQGAQYFFLVAPNAHSVYPDKLPDHVHGAAERPIHQLVGHLEAHSYARLVYPLPELSEHREEAVYPKTGSHWTELGAFVAYQALMREVSRKAAVPVLGRDEIVIIPEERIGDLGHKVDPRMRSRYVYVDMPDSKARVVAHNRVRNTGCRVEYEGPGGTDCLVFGDSFTARIVPFLAESFRRLVFVHMANLDYSLVSELEPELVITVMNERFMIEPPVDVPGPTQRMLEAERLAAGDVMPPRPAETTRVDSTRPSRGSAQ